jgi:hypothetical protein
MEVFCINDAGRPNEIPTSKWVKKAEVYTVIDTIKCNIQSGKIALVLAEIDLKGCEPYKGFSQERFIPVEEIENRMKEYAEAYNT